MPARAYLVAMDAAEIAVKAGDVIEVVLCSSARDPLPEGQTLTLLDHFPALRAKGRRPPAARLPATVVFVGRDVHSAGDCVLVAVCAGQVVRVHRDDLWGERVWVWTHVTDLDDLPVIVAFVRERMAALASAKC